MDSTDERGWFPLRDNPQSSYYGHPPDMNAPSMNPVDDTPGPTLLERTIRAITAAGPLRLNFEDMSGVCQDIPELKLPGDLTVHTCDFCLHAHNQSSMSHEDCVANKMAANRLARLRLSGFYGQCHLGLTDIVEPLVFRGRCLGVFYYGSVIVEGTEQKARQRILKYCSRRGFDPADYLFALKKAVRIPPSSVAGYQANLRLIAELTCKILECYGLPVDRYRTEQGAQFTNSHAIPTLVKGAIRYVHRHYHEEIHLDEAASHLKCNPDYLSRLFNRHLKMGFSEYLLRVRIDHARQLLKTGRYSAGEVGFMVGFSDQSYFGKVFKKWTGVTPRRFSDPEEWGRIEKTVDYMTGFNLSRIDGV